MGRFFAASILALGAGAVHAQEFKGAEVSAEILGYTDDLDFGESNYRGSVEVGLLGAFGIQGDLAFNESRNIDLGSRTLTVHAIYDAFAFGTVGAFWSQDNLDSGGVDEDVTVYGLEGGRSWGGFGAEAYAAHVDDGEGAYLLGAQTRYDLAAAFSLTADGATLRADGDNFGRLAVGGEYRLGAGPALYAEVGRLGFDLAGEQEGATFVTLGARIGLGPQGGTTFGSRGLFDVVTGF